MGKETLEKLVKYYHENKLSHAYLLETNNLERCFTDLKQVIKQIVCQNEYKENCNSCTLCNLIDQNYLPSLVVIEADGINIKKEQVLELKKQFSTIPVYTRENTYIIKNAEKLNGASANSMLKFIEEPDTNIIGFFLTDNANGVISTIKSRCEVIKVYYDTQELNINSIYNDSLKEYTDIAIKYLEKLEVEKKDVIMYNRDIILNSFKEREDIKQIFKIILIIYEELLNKVQGYNNKFLFSNLDSLSYLSYSDIMKRINLVIKFIFDIDSNVNIELLLDKFVIELGDFNE